MKTWCFALAAVCVCSIPSTARAQTQTVLLSDIPRDKREAITLSHRDAGQTDCRISYVTGAPPYATYVVQDKMQSLLSSEKSTPADKYVLYSVAIGTTAVVSSRVIETNMKADQVARISTLINDAVAGRRDTARVNFRLRLDPGVSDEPMRVGPSVTCAPRLANEVTIEKALVKSVMDILKQGQDSVLKATTSVLVDEHGMPVTGSVVKSSGNATYDKLALDTMLKTAKFEAGTVDGKVARVIIEIPLAFAAGPALLRKSLKSGH